MRLIIDNNDIIQEDYKNITQDELECYYNLYTILNKNVYIRIKK